MILAVVVAIPLCVIFGFCIFVQDLIIMQIKGEAVRRGYATIEDGEWNWKE